jgi:hypothetical protein
MVRCINVIPSAITINHLKANSTSVDGHVNIANTLDSTFSCTRSSAHCKDRFRRQITAQEKCPFNFHSKNLKTRYQPLSVTELTGALRKAHNSATGPDEVHYQFLKHFAVGKHQDSIAYFQ